MILRFLFFLIIAYILYRFLFDFVIPIYRTTKQVKKNFREMHDRMNQGMNPPPNEGMYQQAQKTENPNKNKKAEPGDYIDYEEVKEWSPVFLFLHPSDQFSSYNICFVRSSDP